MTTSVPAGQLGPVQTPPLSRLRVAYQIGIVGAIGVLGLAAVGGIYLVQSAKQDALAAVMARSQSAEATSQKLGIDLLLARRAEKDFLLRNEERFIALHGEVMARIERGFIRLRGEVDGAVAADADRAAAGVAEYGRTFTKVAETKKAIGLNENSGLMGRLRGSVHAVEERLKQSSDLGILNLMLQMRRTEKDFLARQDAKYAEAMRKLAGEFDTAGQRLDPAARGDVMAKMTAYQADFAKVVDATLALNAEIKALSDGYAKAAPIIEQVSRTIDSRYEALARESEASRETTKHFILWSIGLVLLVVVGLATVVGRGVSRPIVAMTRTMKRLASGDMQADIAALGNRDEIGDMAKSVQVFKDNMIETERLCAEQESSKRRAEQERRQAMLDLAARFEASVGGIVEGVASAATELQSTAQAMSTTSEETTRQSATVAAASEQATANVQTVATATEELSASIREIGQQVTQSTSLIGEAVKQADRSNAQVQGLAQASTTIGDVVKLINDIAGQTNLLALNATIEAARAGEAGKGFAVVASEVKALATQTGRATDEIAAQIKAIQEATQDSARSIQEIATTIGKVNETATAISAAVEEQGAATQEIARNVTQAAQGTQEVSSNISGVSQAANQTGTAAGQVLAAAGELAKDGETLKSQVDAFLREVRAA